MDWKIVAYVFLGGGLGSVCRFGVSVLTVKNFDQNLPLATLISNLLACVILALSVGVYSQLSGRFDWIRPFVVVGFCGGFSTFSTFGYETVLLLKSQQYGLAVLNILVSIVLCCAAIYALIKLPVD